MPDFSTLCRRQKALAVQLPYRSSGGLLHLLVDSTGIAEIDVSRTALLCELQDDMDLHEDALVIVMSLIDQLHGTRGRLSALMDALAAEEAEVRERIVRRMPR